MSNEKLQFAAGPDITKDKEDAAVAEIICNGEPINWTYWADRQKISPRQAAILAYGIDPIKWQDGEFKQGLWPQDLREKILRLHEWLAERSDSFNLPQLVAVLGEGFASALMVEAVKGPSHQESLPKAGKAGREGWVTKDQLIEAFGIGRQQQGLFKEARGKLKWRDESLMEPGGKGRPRKPALYDPYLFMVGYISSTYGYGMTEEKAWSILEAKFNDAYIQYEAYDRRKA